MHAERKQKRREILAYRAARTERRLAELQRVEARFPWLRLIALVVGLLAAYLAFQLLPFPGGWIVAAAAFAVFMVIVIRHRGVIERITRLETFRGLLAAHIARMDLDWEHIPAPTPLDVPSGHPFATDLNVTGSRSLHQLLDTSASLGGSRRLADWLLAEIPDPARIAARQRGVRELLGRAGFRTRLELDGLLGHPQAGGRWDASGLLRWLETRLPVGSILPTLVALILLAAANISLFTLNVLGRLPPLWIGTFIVYFALQALRFRESSEVFGEAYTLAHMLGQLRPIFADLETYPYDPTSELAGLCAPFWKGSTRPSAALRRIGIIVSAAGLRNNPFLSLLLNILVPWDLFFAYQLERYKQALRGLLPGWLDAWYELEALTSLANFAALNPENTFPAILPPDAQPVFAGQAAGHPLIPDAARVTNDFTLQRLGEVDIITGSNMSGKSTFLRTLGANLVLAYAGSTTACAALRVLPFRVYTSMTLADSLSDGISFFYAEVRRLKALLDQLEANQPLPLFFLIDEIFRGTNNRERQLGSRAYTQALAGKHGAGLISTHDLELVHLAEVIPAVHNFHFREDVQDGRMVFDFRLRPGSSPTTNALRIMALAGLPVPPEGE